MLQLVQPYQFYKLDYFHISHGNNCVLLCANLRGRRTCLTVLSVLRLGGTLHIIWHMLSIVINIWVCSQQCKYILNFDIYSHLYDKITYNIQGTVTVLNLFNSM